MGTAQLRTTLFSKSWVVYAKRPFAGPDHVFAYLGRYTHRVAISNHRLLAVTDDAITFATLGTILSISYGGVQANKRTKEEVSRVTTAHHHRPWWYPMRTDQGRVLRQTPAREPAHR